MTGDEPLSKRLRLDFAFDRLTVAAPATDHDEALRLIAAILNAVEDEFSGVPYNPDEPGSDGRMYPPDERFRYKNWQRLGVRCYRQVAHATFIADKGALVIRSRTGSKLGAILFDKPGCDGRTVEEYVP